MPVRTSTLLVLTLLLALPQSASAISTTIRSLIDVGPGAEINAGDPFEIEIYLDLEGEPFLYGLSIALDTGGGIGSIVPTQAGDDGIASNIHYGFDANPANALCQPGECFGGLSDAGNGIVDEGNGVYRLGVYGPATSVAGFVDQSPQLIARLTLTIGAYGVYTMRTTLGGTTALQDDGSGIFAQALVLDDTQIDHGTLVYAYVPEPGTATLLGMGLLALGLRRRGTCQ